MVTPLPKESENAEVELVLNEYLSFKTLPFAILIKGEWGTGKTYFVQNFLNRKKETNATNDNELICYVSLFGLESPEDVHKAIISKLIIEIDSPSSGAASLLCNTISFFSFSGFEIRKDNILSAVNKKILERIKDKIIIYVFDDFERCHVDRTLLLGVINSYVSDENAKVIIIANEDRLENEQANKAISYEEIKEKIVGVTLNIKPEFNKAISSITNALAEEEDVKNIIGDNAQIILDVFNTGEIINLRMIQKIILEFIRIYTTFDSKIKNDKDFLSTFIHYHSAFSVLVHSGKNVKDLTQEKLFLKTMNKEELSNLEKIVRASVMPESFWIDFYTQGIISDEISKYYNTITYKKSTAPAIILWRFYDIESDDTIIQQVEKLNSDIKDLAYTDIGMILLAFSVQLALANVKLIKKSAKKIVAEAKLYLSKIELSDEDLIEFPQKYFHGDLKWDGSYEGLMFHRDMHGNFDVIKDALKKRRKQALETVFIKGFFNLLEPSNDTQPLRRRLTSLWWDYEGITIFDAIKPNELVECLYTLEGREMGSKATTIAECFIANTPRSDIDKREKLRKWLNKLTSSFNGRFRREQRHMKKFHCKNVVNALKDLIAKEFPPIKPEGTNS